MPLCERRKQSISIRVAQIRGTWRKSVRVDSSEGHLNVREKTLAATLPPINVLILPWVWRRGLPALWCTIVHMLYLLIVTILEMPCSESHLKQAKTDGADICSWQWLYIRTYSNYKRKSNGGMVHRSNAGFAAHSTACNIVFSIEDLGFGTYFVILL